MTGIDQILAHVFRHIQLDEAEQEVFISLLRTKKLRKKEFLLKQGEVCKTENYIVRGCARVYSMDDTGAEHILMFGIEDWWVGDLYSFLTATPSGYFIDVLEDTELLQITKDDLEILYRKVPKFERFFRIIIQNAFIAMQGRINQNLAYSAEQRYLEFIGKYPHFEQRLPQKLVAAYLGITPVFLSMLRRKLAGK